MSIPPCYASLADLLAHGLTVRQAGERLGLTLRSAQTYVREAAKRLPGPGSPKFRLIEWAKTRPGGSEMSNL